MPDNYQQFINFYDLLLEPIMGRTRKRGLQLCAPSPGMLVLDVGCGTGTQLALFQDVGCRVFGVDISPSMLEIARHKLGPAAELILENATGLHFPDGMFDLVTMSLSLHESNPQTRHAVIQECKRVLKPNGKMLITEFNVEGFTGFLGWFRKQVVNIIEFSAGKEHHAGFRHFIASGGVRSLVDEHSLRIEKQISSGGGVFAIFLIGR